MSHRTHQPATRRLRGVGLAGFIALTAACWLPGGAPPAPPAPADEVAIGYGVQEKETVTLDVESASGDALHDRRVMRLEELLEGRFPGVQVMRTGDGGFAVRIRGGGAIPGTGEPLYVVDGTPVRIAAGEGLTWINPFDVERIAVLKGAAAAIYGESAFNGVIVITTRRGG